MIALPRSATPAFAQPSFGGVLAALERWAERRRQRRALLALDDNLRKDIGLSAADAWREGTKPFWRV